MVPSRVQRVDERPPPPDSAPAEPDHRSLFSLGAECSPTPPACGEGPCDEDTELPACISSCVPKLSRADALRATCHTDPCHPDVVGGAVALCPSPLTCVPSTGEPGGGFGTCQDLGQTFATACDPDSPFEACQSGTYCKPTDAYSGTGPGCPNFDNLNGEPGLCALPRREGNGCDANWGNPGCNVCEPGTLCLPDDTRGGRLICQRPCEDDSQCPCDGLSGETSECLEDGACSICIAHRSSCEYREPDPELESLCASDPTEPACADYSRNDPYLCCHPEDECDPALDNPLEPGELALGQCCRPEGAGCEVGGGQCCGDDVCDPASEECVGCGQFGEDPPSGNGDLCCDGLVERDGRCVRPCIEDTGAGCEPCADVEGTWICTDHGDECEVNAPSSASDDCDGLDNDCDRRIDEGWTPPSARCDVEVPGCGVLQDAGTWECTEDGEVCVPNRDAYCSYNFETQVFEGNADACLFGYRRCYGSHTNCPPSSRCISDDCSGSGSFFRCQPLDAMYCDTVGGSPAFVSEPRNCPGQESVCWVPGDTSDMAGCR